MVSANNISEDVKRDQEKALAQMQVLAEDLALAKNLDRAVAAINFLETLPYADIPDILISLTLEELSNKRQKKRIIQTLLESLLNRATHEHVISEDTERIPRLVELQSRLLSIVGGENFRTHKSTFVSLMSQAAQEAKKRTNVYTAHLFPNEGGDLSKIRSLYPRNSVNQEQERPREISSERSHEIQAAKSYPKFKDILIKMSPHINKGAKEIKAGSSSPAEMVYGGVTRFVSDEVAQNIISDKHFKILGREDVAERLLLVLSRYKQQNAVLVGSKGAGKSSIIDLLAEKIVLGYVSQNEVTEFLHEAIVLQTSTGKISGLAKTDKPAGQAQAMEEFFRSVKEVQEKVGRRIIIFIDEIHTLTNAQIESIKPILDSSNGGILLVGASTSPELRTAFKHNEAFLRRIQQIAVREFSEEEILEIFRNSWLKTFEKRHGDIVIDEKVMRLIIRKATMVYPDKGVLDASFILTDDLISYLRFIVNDKSQTKEVSPEKVYSFIQREIGLPVDPSKTKELEVYRANLSNALKNDVLENDRMVDEVLDLWIDLLKNESQRGIRVAAILGRSGTGKSELALQLAVRALGSKERLFVIDGNRYKDANDIKLGIIFGVPGGVSFGQFSSGTLMEWLDDPSKGKHAGIIVINEADKANELFWINFMEFFDTGRIQGGDNKTRIANKHLVILTSNRGDKVLFPRDLESMAEERIRERVYSISEEEIRSLLEEKISETDVNNLPDSIVNRIDLFTVSNLVTPRVAKIIAQKIISYISREHEKSHGVEVKVDDKVIEKFVEAHPTLKRGARPMVRALNRYINTGINQLLGKPEVYVDGTSFIDVKINSINQIEFKYKDHVIHKASPTIEEEANSCSRYFH